MSTLEQKEETSSVECVTHICTIQIHHTQLYFALYVHLCMHIYIVASFSALLGLVCFVGPAAGKNKQHLDHSQHIHTDGGLLCTTVLLEIYNRSYLAQHYLLSSENPPPTLGFFVVLPLIRLLLLLRLCVMYLQYMTYIPIRHQTLADLGGGGGGNLGLIMARNADNLIY